MQVCWCGIGMKGGCWFMGVIVVKGGTMKAIGGGDGSCS